MRKLVLVTLFVVACGGSSKSGGGGVSGTVGGKAFTPAEVRALVVGTGSTPCSLPIPGGGGNLSFGVSALAITFSSFANACADLTASECRLHANAQDVTVLHALLGATGAAPALAPGTFTIHSSPATATPDASGHLVVAFAESVATGAAPTCAGTPSPAAEGGRSRSRPSPPRR